MPITIFRIEQNCQILCQRCDRVCPAIMKVAKDRKMICRTCALKESSNPEAVLKAWLRARNTKAGKLPVSPPVGWTTRNNGIRSLHIGTQAFFLRLSDDERMWNGIRRVLGKVEPIGEFATLADGKAHCEMLARSAVE
tara:strand:- start:2127 stop:2540 length:414 start_codon:yes stop_codon:yes gene_type:complete